MPKKFQKKKLAKQDAARTSIVGKNSSVPVPFQPSRQDIRVQAYVRYPPHQSCLLEDFKKLPNTYLTELDLDTESRLGLRLLMGRLKSNNPLTRLEAYSVMHDLKLYPPLSIHAWLAKAFQTYLDSVGKKSLDELLGLRGAQRRLFHKRDARCRDQLLCEQIFILRRVFSLSIDQAAPMVHARYRDEKWGSVTMLSEEEIKRRYSSDKEWKQHQSLCNEVFGQTLEKWRDEEVREYLGRFPYHSLPPTLQRRHPEH
jgi:hypothetical protein